SIAVLGALHFSGLEAPQLQPALVSVASAVKPEMPPSLVTTAPKVDLLGLAIPTPALGLGLDLNTNVQVSAALSLGGTNKLDIAASVSSDLLGSPLSVQLSVDIV